MNSFERVKLQIFKIFQGFLRPSPRNPHIFLNFTSWPSPPPLDGKLRTPLGSSLLSELFLKMHSQGFIMICGTSRGGEGQKEVKSD